MLLSKAGENADQRCSKDSLNSRRNKGQELVLGTRLPVHGCLLEQSSHKV